MALLDQYGMPLSRKQTARYDAAQTTHENAAHWAQADSLSAVKANSPSIRRILRERSRYECSNSSYLAGIVSSLANFSIGSGPTLNLFMRGESVDSAATTQLEQAFSDWAYGVALPSKLLSMRRAMDIDGEGFGVFTSARTRHSPVTLSLRLYEAEHFDGSVLEGLDDAGVRIDENGSPIAYAFTPEHPSEAWTVKNEWISADKVVHVFRADRPGQLRGIPSTTPCLPLASVLRRYTLATLASAEFAANISGIISQEHTPETECMSPWDVVPFTRNALLTLPGGAGLHQLKAEQPVQGYDEFVRSLMREICRCMNIPQLLALGSAENSNYASSRLDLQVFLKAIETDRQAIFERMALDKIFEAWLEEALLIPGFLPAEFTANIERLNWAWRWNSVGHVDRAKEANGQATELASHTTTLAREYARDGRDWEAELRQRARELALMNELGLSAPVQPTPPVDVNVVDNSAA